MPETPIEDTPAAITHMHDASSWEEAEVTEVEPVESPSSQAAPAEPIPGEVQPVAWSELFDISPSSPSGGALGVTSVK